MGIIISRFRKKKTTLEVLERLETEIKSIEEYGQVTERKHKRVIGYIMAYSVGLYVVLAILYYCMFIGKSQHWTQAIMHASPLLVLPVGVLFIRSGISWWYNWSLRKNRIKLTKLRAEKKKILEEVMNTETYKVAKEILDKFGSPDDQAKPVKPFVPTTNVPGNAPSTPQATPGQLRQRQLTLLKASSTPATNINLSVVPVNNSTPKYVGPRLRSDQLPRPLLDSNRSALDRVVDYLLKDGPNHRMALICSECHSHNGMAMVEEFDYVSYACAYCGKFNPARKRRPAAPPLALSSPSGAQRAIMADVGDDSSVASSGSDSEDDKKSVNNSCSGSDRDRAPTPSSEPEKSSDDKKED